MLQLNDFPIMNPEIVTAIGLMLLFITFSRHRTSGFVYDAVGAHRVLHPVCHPQSVMPKIRSLDPNLADAAMDLGATPLAGAHEGASCRRSCRASSPAR